MSPRPTAAHLLLEESPRWVRGRLEGETVVDSKRVKLLYESGRLPVWLFPEENVRVDLLPSDAIRRRHELVQVEFDALDEWLEEDQPQVGHPPDPYHRIDVRRSSRQDVGAELEPSDHRTVCAYKGHPIHFDVAGEDAVAWTYEDPLHDGLPVNQTQWSRSG